MGRENKGQLLAGAALFLALAALILTAFSLMSRTDWVDLQLTDTSDERFGWRYELAADGRIRPYEPVFSELYIDEMPAGTQAVRITRTMQEDVPGAELIWMSYGSGVEVFLDGAVIYSDFPQAQRAEDGLLRLTSEDWDWARRSRGDTLWQVRMSLPSDYLGRELATVTYFPPDAETLDPVFPALGSEETAVAESVVFSVKYNAIMTVYAILAVSIAGMFLLEVHNGHADGRTLLLCLYFLLLFVYEACSSYAGFYSGLHRYVDQNMVSRLYMVPLYLYLALWLKGRWKWPLCGCVLAWALYEGVREFLRMRQGMAGIADSMGPGALVLLLAVLAAFSVERLRRSDRTPQGRRRAAGYGVAAAVIGAVYLFHKVRVWGSLGSYLYDGIWMAVTMGNYWPVLDPLTDVLSYLMVIALVSEVVSRTIRTRQTVDVLRERSRLTMEGYERVLKAQEATNAANHEMRHHMTALAGLLQDGDADRAMEYVSSVTDALDRLPTVRYSANVLVNAVAGAYLDQAKAQGIRVECSLRVPPELDMADEDISVFLTNLLENALHACQLVEPGRERYIRVKMALHENFLFVGCVNSAPDRRIEEALDEEAGPLREHGYGLEAMRRIAEKYSSMLLLDQRSGEFSVKSNFDLRPARPRTGERT